MFEPEESRRKVFKANTLIFFQTFDLTKDVAFLQLFPDSLVCDIIYIVTSADIVLSILMLFEIFLEADWKSRKVFDYVVTVLQFIVYSILSLFLPPLSVVVIAVVLSFNYCFVVLNNDYETAQDKLVPLRKFIRGYQ